ncbi:hypothetical protein KY285_007680 [Solanum tuberosum]|nr:hypothetical protein KY285_007680 [Solanum tuberosum]
MNHGSAYPGKGSVNKLSTSTSGGNIDNIDKEQHVANTDLFNGKVKGTGKERGGLYYFPSHLSEKVRHVEQGLMAQTENSEGIVWHNRLGHPPKEKLHPPMFPANDIVFDKERVLAEDVPHLEIHDNASVDNANADLEDAQVVPNEMVVEQRTMQSTRSSKPPVWLKDFVTNAISDTMFKLK